VGMMEGAFFVGRTELLEWVNGLLAVNLTKVEQAASGAIYCQILDACHPGTVKMSKVNWMGRSDHEFIPNYKILQSAFDKNNIEKHVPVDMLIRAKYQDNLEMMQWMKAMADRAGAGIRDYDAERAREGKSLPLWAKPVGGAARAETPAEKENCSTNRVAQVASDKKFDPSARRAPARGAVAKAAPQRGLATRTPARQGVAPSLARPSAPEQQELKLKVAEQAEELTAMGDMVDGLEHERDIYFRKLRNVEILCCTLKADNPEVAIADLLEKITGILYAENDEEEPYENLEKPVDAPLEGEEVPLDSPSVGEEVSAASLDAGLEFAGAEQGVMVA